MRCVLIHYNIHIRLVTLVLVVFFAVFVIYKLATRHIIVVSDSDIILRHTRQSTAAKRVGLCVCVCGNLCMFVFKRDVFEGTDFCASGLDTHYLQYARRTHARTHQQQLASMVRHA